jgi:hypothetical protein
MNDYRVWIVAPRTKDGLFLLSIAPMVTSHSGTARTLLTKKELRFLLERYLPSPDTAALAGRLMKGAADRFNPPLSLSDEVASRLGWDFGSASLQPRPFAL